MKRVDEHLAAILEAVQALPPLHLNLLDAHRCQLLDDLVAPYDLPLFDNSSMDGYAVRLADVAGATEEFPAVLPVVADIAAGTARTARVGAGTCARIMTGAPLPPGAEAVVPLEWTDGGAETVRVRRPVSEGLYIRRRGDDVAAGGTVLDAGTRLGAAQLGLLAALGADRIRVRPRPRVVVLSTGSELVEPGTPLVPGMINDSNSFMLTIAADEAGALAYRVGIVPDDPRVLLDTLEDQLVRADMVITTGGVSVGAYDVVKEVLGRVGTVAFEKVAMQPGMPQGFGTVGPDSTPIFTLPGNPVSAFVSFQVFVRPAIRRMMGAEPLHRPLVRARCLERLGSPKGKRQYLRAHYFDAEGKGSVRPVGGPGSHLIGGLARANALIVVPEDQTEVPWGATVEVMRLDAGPDGHPDNSADGADGRTS
jgi:molybdopterin molybdotransferase